MLEANGQHASPSLHHESKLLHACEGLWHATLGNVLLLLVQDDVTTVIAIGPAILASSVDGCIRRFDVRMGRVYTDDLHHSIASLAVSRDGLCVLAACLDSHLRLLDVQAGELLASYSGHTHESVRMGCAFTADDQHVIGCSEDGEQLRLAAGHRPCSLTDRGIQSGRSVPCTSAKRCKAKTSQSKRDIHRVSKLLSIAIWIVVLLGLVEKVNINQISDFW
jgi:WD40 repeat protein